MGHVTKIPDRRQPQGTGVRDKLKVLKLLHWEKRKEATDFN